MFFMLRRNIDDYDISLNKVTDIITAKYSAKFIKEKSINTSMHDCSIKKYSIDDYNVWFIYDSWDGLSVKGRKKIVDEICNYLDELHPQLISG